METFSRETLEPWFVTGFTDGEGTFTFSRSGYNMQLYFALKQTAAADTELLERVRYFFNAGKLYNVKARPPGGRSGATKRATLFRINQVGDLGRVVLHFDKYPLQSIKKQSYEIWREMVIEKMSFRNPDREKLEELALRLSAVAVRRQPWSAD